MKLDLFSVPVRYLEVPVDLQKLMLELNTNWQETWLRGTFDITSEMHKLKQFIDVEATNYFKECGFINTTLKTTNLWLNENRHSDFILPHHHGCNLVSWSYYIAVPENSGDIVFVDPKGNNSWDYFTASQIEKSKRNGKYIFSVKPKINHILIFPSWVQHYVEPNKSTETRLSISGDYHCEDFVNFYDTLSVHATRDLHKHSGNYNKETLK